MRFLSAILLSLLVSCASGGNTNDDDIFGVAKSATPSAVYEGPTTRDDWVEIADKINNGQYDISVAVAMTVYEMPPDLDSPELRSKLQKLAYDHMLENANNTEYVETFLLTRKSKSGEVLPDNKRALPDTDELNEIWTRMRKEIEAQNSEKAID